MYLLGRRYALPDELTYLSCWSSQASLRRVMHASAQRAEVWDRAAIHRPCFIARGWAAVMHAGRDQVFSMPQKWLWDAERRDGACVHGSEWEARQRFGACAQKFLALMVRHTAGTVASRGVFIAPMLIRGTAAAIALLPWFARRGREAVRLARGAKCPTDIAATKKHLKCHTPSMLLLGGIWFKFRGVCYIDYKCMRLTSYMSLWVSAGLGEYQAGFKTQVCCANEVEQLAGSGMRLSICSPFQLIEDTALHTYCLQEARDGSSSPLTGKYTCAEKDYLLIHYCLQAAHCVVSWGL